MNNAHHKPGQDTSASPGQGEFDSPDPDDLFERLYECTQFIFQQVERIHPHMEDNETEEIEQLYQMVSERGEVISELKAQVNGDFPYLGTRQEQLKQMKKWEDHLQPKLQEIYQSFSSQIQHLQQGKKLARHYHEGYVHPYTDGAYIDQRK